jgi:hypothetical protein
MGKILGPGSGWGRRSGQDGSGETPRVTPTDDGSAAIAVPVTHLVKGYERNVSATTDLEGHLGIFVETVSHPSIMVGSRVCLRVRSHEFSCVVSSMTRDPDDVLGGGLYLSLETEDDRHRAAYYFATRDAVFFDP